MESPSATLVCDHMENLPLTHHLAEEDLILLLTPVIVPPRDTPRSQDPFEALGRAIAFQHPLVRHVPYTKKGGITDAHAVFIKRCRVIIFVITGPASADEPRQASFADKTFDIGDKRPHIVIACCDIGSHDLHAEPFPTIVRATSHSPPSLAQAANILFGVEPTPSLSPTPPRLPTPSPPPTPPRWPILSWSPNRDLPAISSLFHAVLPAPFYLPQHVLASLLRRDGYAMHYTVRDPDTDTLVAFCATYTTYPTTSAPRLLGSMALLFVHPAHRNRGIGTALHDVALTQLRRTPAVDALMLGSAFPRLLTGIPSDSASKAWFVKRGWSDLRPDGEVSDWTLSFGDAPPSPSTAGLEFRACEQGDLGAVLAFVENGARGSVEGGRVGYGEQFSRLAGTSHVEDVIVGFEGRDIVAAAVVYVPRDGSPAAEDIPWARTLGEDVGGATCVCIEDGKPQVVSSKDTILVRLLDACMKRLARRDMKHIYVDGLRGSDETMRKLGFRQWAKYSSSGHKS